MNMLIVIAAVVIASLVFYFYQQTSKTLKRLEAEGFVVDVKIPSNPQLVIDTKQHRMAVIYTDHYDDFRFEQITAVDEEMLNTGGGQEPTALVFTLKDHPKSEIRVRSKSRQQVMDWQAQINQLLGR